jgi:molybdate transport system ATP-binding protein
VSSLAVDLTLTHPIALHAAFDINGFTALLGRSGAGKTSLLRAIAGLLPSTGTPFAGLPPESRPIGYLPQNTALFPHLTVLQNAAFALTGPDRFLRARALLEDLAIAHLADRPATQISGGEAQRAALARALARAPALLLLDEPSAALDATTRDAVLAQLIETITARQIPALAATHDPAIAALADWLVLLSGGAIIRQGTPRALFTDPQTQTAARLLGYQNFWVENGITHTIRAEDITLAPSGRPATINAIRRQGLGLRLVCAAPEPFIMLLPNGDSSDYRIGQPVHLYLNPELRRRLID